MIDRRNAPARNRIRLFASGGFVALALTALLLAAGVLTAAPGGAQSSATCPEGQVPAADGQGCVSTSVDENVVVTRSCTRGVLSADGQTCVVPRIDQPAPASPVAPEAGGGPAGGAAGAPAAPGGAPAVMFTG